MPTFCDNDKCSREIIGRYVYNNDKKILKGKKFCSMACMEQYYRTYSGENLGGGKPSSSSSDFNWKDYQGWIIGGGIFLVLLIILGLVFGGKKKKRR